MYAEFNQSSNFLDAIGHRFITQKRKLKMRGSEACFWGLNGVCVICFQNERALLEHGCIRVLHTLYAKIDFIVFNHQTFVSCSESVILVKIMHD